jgi:hypothetical protein
MRRRDFIALLVGTAGIRHLVSRDFCAAAITAGRWLSKQPICRRTYRARRRISAGARERRL